MDLALFGLSSNGSLTDKGKVNENSSSNGIGDDDFHDCRCGGNKGALRRRCTVGHFRPDPQFEKASGYRVAVTYVSPGGALRDRVLADKDVDLAFVPSPVLGDIEKAGKIVAGSRVEIARTPLAVGIRSGTPRLDLSTTDGVKRAVIAANSIALSDPNANSPIGAYFMRIADQFGFGPQLKARTLLVNGGGVAVAEAVASGKADMTVTLMSEILAGSGAEVAGPLPREMQKRHHNLCHNRSRRQGARRRPSIDRFSTYARSGGGI